MATLPPASEFPLTCYVLEENEWNVSLAAQFDEVRPLKEDFTFSESSLFPPQ